MHKTTAGEKRKALREEALELARDARLAMKAAKTLTEAGEKARELEGQADSLKAEAEALKGAARLEDLHIWQMDKFKTTKKGKTTYGYWMASWREGDRVHNVHIGSCAKVDREAAMKKARKMKADALGMSRC
jgi:hypothetical protein